MTAIARDLVFERMHDPVVVIDPDGRIVDCNRAGAALLIIAEDPAAAPPGHVDRYPAIASVARSTAPEEDEGPEIVVGERTFGSRSIHVAGDSGEPRARAIVLRDVTRRTQAERMLQALATTDELTRVPNRRQFLDLAQRVVAQARRSGRPVAWLTFDIDRFRTVNDRYGHRIGDLVLTSVAAIASASVRAGDVLGRIGGEEFALCLPDTDAGGAVIIAERLRASIADLRVGIPDGYVQATVSVGVHAAAGADADLETSMAKADEAQGRAKRAGGDRVESTDSAAE